jgi:hypothetical protein
MRASPRIWKKFLATGNGWEFFTNVWSVIGFDVQKILAELGGPTVEREVLLNSAIAGVS